MIYNTIIVFDYFRSIVTIITHMKLPELAPDNIAPAYREACETLESVKATILGSETPLPPQGKPDAESNLMEARYSSNVGRAGYETFVTKLKENIMAGDIIQAVPSQRLSRSTSVHPFNIYRTLRSLNPSPYVFYLSCATFSLLGASPECMMSASTHESPDAPPKLRIVNHAIAGTIHREKTAAEDEALAKELQGSNKDRAEHVMLVDLTRNDVNRVCDLMTVHVDRLMKVDKFSHVQHLTSEVSGVLRAGMTRWDAFRSIFPAGTVSGAPKIRAI
jgi:anthranilate synthase component 1